MKAGITFALPTLNRGGAERVLVSLARKLAESNFDIALVVLQSANALQEDLPAGARLLKLQTARASLCVVDLAFLETIRAYELGVALRELRSLGIPSKGRLLEVGAGSGWQSRRLAQAGYSVEAVDLEESNYSNVRVWTITNYDGKHLPFPDNDFDVVFSSNVLEHVRGLDELQNEMWRVLKPDGVALHIVPSATWRLWTNVTYYPAKTRGLISRFAKRHAEAVGVQAREIAPPTLASILSALLPARHGEIGNALSETFHFTRFTWAKRLVRAGWQEIGYVPNQLVYSGNNLFGDAIQIESRAWLSRYLGSSCHLFILKKTP